MSDGILGLAEGHRAWSKSLERLNYSKENPITVNAANVSHHGSKNNITPKFLELVDAEHWLFSSHGDTHDHPDQKAVEAVIRGAIRKPTLWFNYRSAFNEKWELGAQEPNARYRAKDPDKGNEGIVVTL
jgi:hypothetical protein